jgi:hypothetical protein
MTGTGALRLQVLQLNRENKKCNRQDSSPVISYTSARSA